MFKFILVILIFCCSFSSWSIWDGALQKISFPDPVNITTFTIESKVYRPVVPTDSIFPVVGETFLDGALAFNLCASGIGAYILDVLNDPSEVEQILFRGSE